MDAYIGEIRLFAGDFAPAKWLFCNGQLLPVREPYINLFSIIGICYGGNGSTNFALPDLRTKVPMNQGSGQGLTPRIVGQTAGSNTVTLKKEEIPLHTHVPQLVVNSEVNTPTEGYWANTNNIRGGAKAYAPLGEKTPLSNVAIGNTGGSLPHNNMQPYLCLNFIICYDGKFPQKG
jgi:microcystin-dependent protein